MAARCFVDSCGLIWKEVVTGSGPGFEVDLDFADIGSIKCDDAPHDGVGAGLYVDLLDDTAQAIVPGRECANILRRDAAGQLHAVIPNARTYTVVGDMRSIPNNGTQAPSGPSETTVITNNTGCAALLVLRGQFEVNVEVADTMVGPPPLLPINTDYNALFQMSLIFNGTPVDVQYSTMGGRKPVAGRMYLKEWRDISYIQAMTAGQVITITDSVVHDLTEGDIGLRRNITANIATAPPDFHVGYRVVLTASILPIGSIVGA